MPTIDWTDAAYLLVALVALVACVVMWGAGR